MTPSLDLMLATIERALAATILPAAGNAAAREEASLAILFARWLRDVVDAAADAERASYRDCRATLALIGGAIPPAEPETAAEIRSETRRMKKLLGDSLAALRHSGDDAGARTLRAELFDLASREIDLERAFGRATGLDPDSPSIPSLSTLLKETR